MRLFAAQCTAWIASKRLHSAVGDLARGRRRTAVRQLLADGGEIAIAVLAALPPDGPAAFTLAERLRFGPPETWHAWRPDLGQVALKLADASDAERRTTFRHPGVAPFLGHGPGWHALAWIAGPTLAATRSAPHGTLEAIAAAVSALHSAGLAHGDLTPANIVLSSAGPVLIDWGEDCAGTPGWRPVGEGASPMRRDLFALERLSRLLRFPHSR
ncbi:MAG: phosphotransferase [Pseudomonadota bacterium]